MQRTAFFKSQFVEKTLKIRAKNLKNFSRFWTDTRTLQKGDLFVAIPGEKFDGHDYIEQAAAAGAVGAIVSKKNLKAPKDFALIEVKNTTEALRSLAKAYRKTLKVPVFAVAGSNGKTTTKEWLAYLLRQMHSNTLVFKTEKSNNSILGIALSLLQIRKEKFAVIEIGIDEPGWMAKHLEVVQPTHGLITTIAEEHMNRMKSIETVAKEELKLHGYLQKSKAYFASNEDSPWIAKAKKNIHTLSYALDAKAEIEGKYLAPQTLHCFGLEFWNPLPGKHNAQNLLAALAGLRLLHPEIELEDLKKLAKSTKTFSGEPHRSRWLQFQNDIRVYDDCYNANTDSMEKALSAFLELSDGCIQRAVIGDMLDLGEASEAAHRKILNLFLVSGIDHIYAFGKNFEKAATSLSMKPENLQTFQNIDDLRKNLQTSLQQGDAIFLKGSRGMALERVIADWK